MKLIRPRSIRSPGRQRLLLDVYFELAKGVKGSMQLHSQRNDIPELWVNTVLTWTCMQEHRLLNRVLNVTTVVQARNGKSRVTISAADRFTSAPIHFCWWILSLVEICQGQLDTPPLLFRWIYGLRMTGSITLNATSTVHAPRLC